MEDGVKDEPRFDMRKALEAKAPKRERTPDKDFDVEPSWISGEPAPKREKTKPRARAVQRVWPCNTRNVMSVVHQALVDNKDVAHYVTVFGLESNRDGAPITTAEEGHVDDKKKKKKKDWTMDAGCAHEIYHLVDARDCMYTFKDTKSSICFGYDQWIGMFQEGGAADHIVQYLREDDDNVAVICATHEDISAVLAQIVAKKFSFQSRSSLGNVRRVGQATSTALAKACNWKTALDWIKQAKTDADMRKRALEYYTDYGDDL